MNSTTKRLLRAIEVLAWGVFFVFAALALALRFWILPDVERHREDIVAALSRGIGLPVKVGVIEAGWLGLRPQITLSDVRIHDAQGHEALVLPSIHNVIAWRSLLAGELRLHRMAIEGPRLAVRRDPAGEIYVAGMKIARGAGGGQAGAGLGAFLAQGDIVIRHAEIEWRDELRSAPPLVFSEVELALVNSGAAHALGLKARTAEELGGSFELRALVEGEALPPGAWNGRVFLQVGYTDLNAWRPWVDYPVNLRQGHGALRIWTSIEGGQVREGSADVALTGVRMSLADELSPLELASLNGRVRMRALPDGAELSGRGISLALESGPEIPKTDFEIVWRPQAGGRVGASVVDLEAVRHLVDSLPVPPQLPATLDELAPRGRLADLRLEWTGPFDAPQRFAARTRFSDLALRARGDTPGFSGLSGSLDATEDRGKLVLASGRSVLELPRLFPEPHVALDSLAGEIGWERDKARGFTVRVASLSFANLHASGNLFGSYTRQGEGPGSLDLSAVLNRVDGKHVARYLPHAALMGGEALRNWLGDAIVAGEASDVRARLRGDLRQFPFTDPATGEFKVTARVEKGVLDYARGWPRIQDIAADLNFERDRLEIVGRSGTILGARVADVRVGIPSLGSPGRRVLVSGRAEGPTEAFLGYVQSSPLLQKAGGFVADMKAAGGGKLRLKLELPLADMAKTEVAGEYEFAANQVTVAPWLPPVDAAAGRLAFTASKLTLHNVRGRFLGGNVALTGGTRPGRGVEVSARGNATAEATRALFDNPLSKDVSGAFAYAATVREQEGRARIFFESSLRGVESRLPAPLAKAAAEALPLRVEVTPAARGARDRISVSLGGVARAEVARRREGNAGGAAMVVQRAGVWLSPARDQPVRLPERPGTLVYGALPELDFDGWLPLLSADRGPQAASQAVSLDLKFGALDALGKRFHNVALRGSSAAAGWSANVKADELAGDVSFRAGKAPRLIGRLAHLTIPEDTPAKPSPPKPRPALRPAELPAIDLTAEDFTFRGKQLGRLELAASRTGDDWRVESMKMVNPDAAVSVRGLWRGAPSRTAMNFDLRASDVGAFLARVGNPGLVKGGRAHLQGSLAWQGDPGTVHFPTLGGEVQMQAEDGQFLEIEPGLGKLISLMSLQALPRRITLDFRDVFSKGFQFDRISSAAQVEKGVIKLKEFRMRGSAADVAMTGDVDLARETQDLRVRVVPSLGDSAAIGITLVNPVAGVAAAIAQRILKDPLGQIFAFDYSISGSWSDPKVAKIPQPPVTVPEAQNN